MQSHHSHPPSASAWRIIQQWSAQMDHHGVVYLCGYVNGVMVKTSPIRTVDPIHRRARSTNTLYQLGEMDQTWAATMVRQNSYIGPSLFSGFFAAGDANIEVCSICLEPMSTDIQVILGACAHRFHYACVETLLRTCNRTCPICRGDIPIDRLVPISKLTDRLIDEEPVGSADAFTLDASAVCLEGYVKHEYLPASGETAVVFRVSVPEAPIDAMAIIPTDFVYIVDTSPSMGASGRLDMVKQCLRFQIGRMRSGDRVAIVSFDETACVRCGLTRVPEKSAHVLSVIDRMRTSGTTRIDLGVIQALDLLNRRRHRNPNTRIFLLSDGEQDAAASCCNALHQLAQMQHCVMDVFGYGNDHDTTTLARFAETGRGTFTRMSNAAAEVMGAAFGMAVSIAATNVTLTVRSSVPITSTMGFDDVDGRVLQMPALSYGQSRDVLINVQFDSRVGTAWTVTAELTQHDKPLASRQCDLPSMLHNQYGPVHMAVSEQENRRVQIDTMTIILARSHDPSACLAVVDDALDRIHASAAFAKIQAARDYVIEMIRPLALTEVEYTKVVNWMSTIDDRLSHLPHGDANNNAPIRDAMIAEASVGPITHLALEELCIARQQLITTINQSSAIDRSRSMQTVVRHATTVRRQASAQMTLHQGDDYVTPSAGIYMSGATHYFSQQAIHEIVDN